jgi:hypothetical protein
MSGKYERCQPGSSCTALPQCLPSPLRAQRRRARRCQRPAPRRPLHERTMDSARHVIQRILNPNFFSQLACYDVASIIHESLPTPSMNADASSGSPNQGLTDIARHVIGCHLIQETRPRNAFDDLASTINQCSPRHRMPFHSRNEGS